MTKPDEMAYPTPGVFDGLTKREYFAAMAASSLAGAYSEYREAHAVQVAKHAVEVADALIEALNKDASAQTN